MINIDYEVYVNDNLKRYKTARMENLKELEDWIFKQMHQDYSDKREGRWCMNFPTPEHVKSTHSDGPYAIHFRPDEGGASIYIYLISNKDGIIFSDGRATAHQKLWTKEVQDWLLHCDERQYAPKFNFVSSDNLKERQKAEAVKRMRKLHIMTNPIKEFVNEGKLNLSECGGILYWLNEKERKIVDDFEKKYGCLVYHVIKNRTELGTMYSLMYVSKNTEEWQMDMDDLDEGQACVYVANVDAPDCSEFGTIGIRPSVGGVARIW